MGAKARSLLNIPGFSGKVFAVLSTTTYLLSSGGEMLWVALEGMPAHRRCLQASFQPNSLTSGQGFFTQNTCLRIGQDVAIETDQAVEWEPSAIEPGQAEPLPTVNTCLQGLFAALPGPGKGAGLGQAIPLILDIAAGRNMTTFLPDSLVARAFGPIMEIARASISQGISQVAKKGRELVGLGPGLTPSGDDFLGGLLFAAHSLKTAYPGSFYWEQEAIADLVDWAQTQTNPLSHAVLSDLALGHGPEPLHDLLTSLLTGQDLGCVMEAVARLLGIGHTSGWDMLAGALTGMLLVTGKLNEESINAKHEIRNFFV
jgi:hypothetical protein